MVKSAAPTQLRRALSNGTRLKLWILFFPSPVHRLQEVQVRKHLWDLTKYSGNLTGADKSAVGAMNRPLRRLRRPWYTVFHLLISINARSLAR